NHRASWVAAISRLNGSASEMTASRFSAGVMHAALVRGVTISTSSGGPTGASRRLSASHMLPSQVRCGTARGLRGDHLEHGQVLVPHGLELGGSQAGPALAAKGLADIHDLAGRPAQLPTQPQHYRP